MSSGRRRNWLKRAQLRFQADELQAQDAELTAGARSSTGLFVIVFGVSITESPQEAL